MARFIRLTVVGLLLGALLTACGGGAGGTGGTGGLIMEMGDLYYKPDTLTAKPGQTLQITLDNRGSLEHNFVLYDRRRPDGALREGRHPARPEGEHLLEGPGEARRL
jgi:plastocyanin